MQVLQDMPYKLFPKADTVSSQAWLNILRLSLYNSTLSKSLKVHRVPWFEFIDVEEQKFMKHTVPARKHWTFVFVLSFLQKVDLCLEFGWNHRHIPLAIFWPRVSNAIWCLPNMNRAKSIPPYPYPTCHVHFCKTIRWPIEDELVPMSLLCGKRLSKNWILTLAAKGSNSNFFVSFLCEVLSSATDRVSDKAMQIDGIWLHELPSAGRNVCNGESTFSVGRKGRGLSFPDGGRWKDE